MKSMRLLFLNNSLPILLVLWVIINLIQAGFTELADDEAYYWMYSRFLAWGYFDHPPMQALWIKLGCLIFGNIEFGVRFFTVLLSSIWVLLLYKSMEVKSKHFFLFVMLSIPVWQIYSFIATPDAPLLLFAALYWWVYNKYTKQKNTIHAILLGLSISALLYSKYHGILLIFFTLLANPKEVLNRNFYLVLLVALVCFMPHVVWQYQHDFPSIKYHLFERSGDGFNWFYLPEYILNQIVMFGLLFPLLIYLLLALKDKFRESDFSRAAYFNVIGVFLFFLMSSFKGHVEPHWTAIALFPLLYLVYPKLEEKLNYHNTIYRLSFFTIVILLLFRVILMVDVLPIKSEFHGAKIWTQKTESIAKDANVCFQDSYQKASKFNFYTAGNAVSVSSIHHRRNQYDLWIQEQKLGAELLHQPVLMFQKYSLEKDTILFKKCTDFLFPQWLKAIDFAPVENSKNMFTAKFENKYLENHDVKKFLFTLYVEYENGARKIYPLDRLRSANNQNLLGATQSIELDHAKHYFLTANNYCTREYRISEIITIKK